MPEALAALIAVFTGLSYAELSSIFPRASAEYEYTNRAFGKRLAFVIGWLIIFSGVIGASTVALGFGGYFEALTGASALPSAVLLILALSIILLWGIKISAWFAIVFTLIETVGLLIVICIGVPHLGSVDYLDMPNGLRGVFEAAALIFFAYMGFEEMVKLSEETRDPERNMPLALMAALAITILLYILVALSVVSVVPPEVLAASAAPFAEVAAEALGPEAFVVVSAIALFATANTVLLMLLAASRIAYGMAESASLPTVLGRVHPGRRTPMVAIVAVMLLSIAFLFSGDIAFVASANDFILFATFVVLEAEGAGAPQALPGSLRLRLGSRPAGPGDSDLPLPDRPPGRGGDPPRFGDRRRRRAHRPGEMAKIRLTPHPAGLIFGPSRGRARRAPASRRLARWRNGPPWGRRAFRTFPRRCTFFPDSSRHNR